MNVPHSPDRALTESDLFWSLSREFPHLTLSDRNKNNTAWNSRLTTAICSLVLDYAHSDIFSIVVVKTFVLPLRLAVGTRVSSGHLAVPIIVGNTCTLAF